MVKSNDFLKAFKELGDTFSFETSYFPIIEKFTCCLFGVKQCNDVNEARYSKFCTTVKATEPHKLPQQEMHYYATVRELPTLQL